MARIALGITLVLLLATCFFGWETRSKVQGLDDKVAQLDATLSSTQNTLAKTKADLSTTKDSLAKETADDEQTKSTLASTQSSLDAANAQVTTLKGQIDDLNKQIAQMKPSGTPGAVVQGPTQADFDALKKQFTDAQAQVAELNQLKDTLTNKVKDAQSRADDLEKVVEHYKNGTVRNGLEGEVLAVNQGWNFVVLSIGDRQGAVANAELIIKRGGSQIGKARITSVEPSTSVADIIPGSLARGVRIEPGDRVIFPGS